MPVCLYLVTGHRGIFVISVCFSSSGHCGAVNRVSVADEKWYVDVYDIYMHVCVLPDLTNSIYTHLFVCEHEFFCVFLFLCTRVCHQTRQCMMLSAAEDMRTTIYNSPLSRLRHTVLPHGTGACASLWPRVSAFLCVCMQQSGKYEWETVNMIDGGKELRTTASVCVRVVCVCVCAGAASWRCEWKETCHTWQGWNERIWLAVFWCHGLWVVPIKNNHTLLSHSISLLSTALPFSPLFSPSALHQRFIPLCL